MTPEAQDHQLLRTLVEIFGGNGLSQLQQNELAILKIAEFRERVIKETFHHSLEGKYQDCDLMTPLALK